MLSDLHLGDFRRLQRDFVDGLALAGVGHRGVNLGRGDVLVAEDMLDSIDAGARVVIVKQWKKCGTIYKNLLRLKRIINSNIDDKLIYQAAMTRLGWYRQCGQSVFNYLLSPQVLAMPKVNRTDKRKSRPGLVDPYSLYLNLRTPMCM